MEIVKVLNFFAPPLQQVLPTEKKLHSVAFFGVVEFNTPVFQSLSSSSS